MQVYQSILPQIREHGAALVAVSPMLPDNSLSMADRNALEFEVLSDLGNAVARSYGIVFRVPDEVRALYETRLDLLLPQVNGDDSWELPVPGTFVIGRDGKVAYAFVEPDYTRRAEPAEIVGALDRGP